MLHIYHCYCRHVPKPMYYPPPPHIGSTTVCGTYGQASQPRSAARVTSQGRSAGLGRRILRVISAVGSSYSAGCTWNSLFMTAKNGGGGGVGLLTPSQQPESQNLKAPPLPQSCKPSHYFSLCGSLFHSSSILLLFAPVVNVLHLAIKVIQPVVEKTRVWRCYWSSPATRTTSGLRD